MNYNKSFFGLLLAILVVLPGCILHVPSYRRQPLRIMRDSFMYSGSDKNVVIRVKQLNKADKYDFFGEHIGAIKDGKYKVIYISVNNLSNEDYILPADCIDLKQISSHSVVKSMKKTSSLGRLGLYAVASVNPLFFMSDQNPAIIPVAICVIPALTIVSCIGFVQGVKSVVMNRRVRKDIEEKVIPSKVIINSGDYYEGLIFVKSADYTPQFSIALHEKGKAKNILTFDVDLRKVE